MSLLNVSRWSIFWIVDFCKGSPVRSHYRQISKILENRADEKLIQQGIDNLISHAINTTPYYKNVSNKSCLADFPIVNKSVIRDNFNSFRSDLYLDDTQLISMITSGSTGTPFKVYQNKNKKNRNYADTLYFAKRANFDVGDLLFYLKIWVKEKMQSGLKFRIQNIVPIDVITFNDAQIDELIADMKKQRTGFGILGYASALELIAKKMEHDSVGLIKTKLKSVIAISESLTDYTVEKFKEHLGVKVVSRYSNLENGIIAQQMPEDNENYYLINRASYHLEILKLESDEIASENEIGRIVITDLYNYAMPLIRYDTGDLGVMVITNDGIPYLKSVMGRKLDQIFNTKGELVSSYIVYKNMWQYTEIIQYQLIQENRNEYLIKINHDGTFKRENQLIAEFKIYLGEDALITIEYIDDIPLLNSGKRKKIVNNYIITK